MIKYLTILTASVLVCSALAHESDLRHWEIPSPDPDRIFLTFIGDPATSRAVTWRTDNSIINAVAEIAPALGEPCFYRNTQQTVAQTEIVELSAIMKDERDPVHYHSAIFQQLEPDTLYAYRVGDGGKRWSEWIQFRTASTEPAPFKFVYFGDAQNDVFSRWSRVIRMAHQTAPDATFALHAGDLINKANADPEWAGWFKAGSYLHAQWTGVPVVGNHEYVQAGASTTAQKTMSALWRPQFTLPVEKDLPESLHESVYSFDYQDCRIIALNSCTEIQAQTVYLEEQLKKPGCKWKIVSFHHPIFTPGARSNYTAEERNKWKELFNTYNVDLVLQGHDHSYARGQVPVINNDGTPGEDFQTLYVTAVSGPKQYPVKTEHLETYATEGFSAIRNGENTQFFQVIEVEPDRISYNAYTATGELYDRAIIKKASSKGRKTITQQISDIPERTFENTIPYSRKNP